MRGNGLPEEQVAAGRLEVIGGCMFAGKTSRLIELLGAAEAAGRRVAVFKHTLDTRYDAACLATHDGRRLAAIAVPDAAALLTAADGHDVVGIDEGQFFECGLPEACAALRGAGRRVIVVGIDFNAWGRPFEPLPTLMRMADAVEVLTAPCTRCGSPARYSQRMVPVASRCMVGGPGDYQPRCEVCFVPLAAPEAG